jgi:hypothetical protein
MHPMREKRFPLVATILVAALVLGPALALAQEPAEPGTSSIAGKLAGGDPKRPVAGATVLAYHLSTAQIYRSSVTLTDGRYEVVGLPHGYYDLAIETSDGFYVANQVVNVPPDGKAVANLELVPAEDAGQPPREFPGSDQTPSGIAQMLKKSKKKGIAILAGVGGAAAVAAAAGGSSGGGGYVSPITPN